MAKTLRQYQEQTDTSTVDDHFSHAQGLVDELDWSMRSGYVPPVNSAGADAYFRQVGENASVDQCFSQLGKLALQVHNHLPHSLGFVKLPSIHCNDPRLEPRN
jgi:hypothetical protein